MKVLKFLNKYKFIFISGLLAAVVSILIYGTRVINPRNVEWILLKGGDMGQHYLGWEFFRQSPWHFPIGLSSNISYPFLVSVIFTDSIPLWAVFFKIFSFILPNSFQYFGIYGLVCFILNGITYSS